jgi:ethanolamine utilization protein EutA
MADEHDIDGFEHDHNFPEGADWIAEDIEGIEKLTLTSVGIDIGSSTTHCIFSKLTLRREGAAFSAHFRVSEREILDRSEIMLTPYITGTQIDTEKVKDFIHANYAKAGLTPADIDTGAVVITGEALKKENAKPIAEFFAADSGKFICASAGPNHEAVLAAYGCGAVAISKAEDIVVLNIDVGGGTTKFSIIKDGTVAQTCAVEVGARLIAFDQNEVVTRLEEPAKKIMPEAGGYVALGEKVSLEDREKFAEVEARILFEIVKGGPHSQLTKDLLLTEPLTGYDNLQGIGAIVFSGGVSEYVYDHYRTVFGDLGPLLGAAIRGQLAQLPKNLVREPEEGIRATVIGAGEYTVQASGTTSYISDKGALPAYALQVIRPLLEEGSVADSIRQALSKFDLDRMIPGLAVAISLKGQQNYQSLRKLADGIVEVLEEAEEGQWPLFIVMNLDVAKSLGGILKEELDLEREVIALDGIEVGDLEYLDVGRPVGASEVLPVTVKSLLFPSDQEANQKIPVQAL